jgi:nicotinamidase-related amidase
VRSFQGVDIATTLADLLTPAHLALVVYDMQVGICSQIADGDRVVSAVGKVLEVARKAGVRTIFTRHMSLPVQLMGSMAFRTAMAWQRTDDPEKVSPWFLRDSRGFALVPELQPLPGEVVFDKIAMSAFEGTPLGVTLRDCGVKAVAFVGIGLEIGIEPSVRHAADLGFTPIIVTDACGFGHKVAADRSLVALTFSGDAVIVDQATFSAELRR